MKSRFGSNLGAIFPPPRHRIGRIGEQPPEILYSKLSVILGLLASQEFARLFFTYILHFAPGREPTGGYFSLNVMEM